MDILNNRELALLIWLLVFIIFVTFSKKMDKVRESIKPVCRLLLQKKIVSIHILMLIYITLLIVLLFKIGLWETYQLKNTIIWTLSVGALSLYKIKPIKESHNFLKSLVLDNLKLVAIIQFVIGVYTFRFFIEILIVPFTVILGAMIAFMETDKDDSVLKNLLNKVMVLFGTILIFHTLYMLFTNFSAFSKVQTIYNFYIPPLLSLLYLPFIFIIMTFMTYETAYFRLKYIIKDPEVLRFAKLYSIFKFHFRLKLLERWVSILNKHDTSSNNGIKDSISSIFKMLATEKNPPKIPIEEGWSPYEAKQFLINEGLKTDYYHPITNQEWCAFSNYLEIDNEIFSNKISYYVDGNKKAATSLKIILMVFSKDSAKKAHEKLLSTVNALFKNALNKDTPFEIESAIMKGENEEVHIDTCLASIERINWPQSPEGAYDLKFILKHQKHIGADF